ncbi:MAG: SDR family NAD(P)-dependent oxidoreductase [Rhodobacteraceae bacterium]|nr:SDR family NAD(P)-dependent oxidoreductase [Paracoccaceae bacterium]
MQTVLITGANRGLGLEFARQYAAAGWNVIATCRRPDTADELKELDVELMLLDVGDSLACENNLSDQLGARKIDLLINNAGMMGDRTTTALNAKPPEWREAFNVNVLGPAIVTRLLLPNLKLSKAPVAATLGSQAGIFSNMTSENNCIYTSTKAAAHAVTISLGFALKEEGVTYISLRPGPTKTRMLGDAGTYEVDDSVQAMRVVLANVTPEWAGLFLDRTGVPLPL